VDLLTRKAYTFDDESKGMNQVSEDEPPAGHADAVKRPAWS
jgi:hypothetical protein